MDRVQRIERRLKLQDFRVLVSVVQAGNMHRAAEILGTSQPAVSRSILDLERALGVRLFDRSPRGVEPTHYGRALFKRGIAVFDELRQGIKDIEFLGDSTAGELRIGCTEAIATGPAFTVIDRLMRRHPKITFNVMTGGEEALHIALEDRKIELVMTAVSGALPNWIVTETLFKDSLIVAAGPQNPWTRRRKTELAELMNERWVLLPPDRPAGALIVEVFRACGLEVPASSFITASLNLRNRLIATGRFLTMQSRYTVAPRSNYPLLKELPVKLPNTQRTVSILTAKKRTISPVAELFMRTARESFKRLDD